MLGRAGSGEVEDGEVVRVVEVIEFGGAEDLRFFLKRGVFAEVQVGQFAEFVERDDVGDFVAMEGGPAVARRRKISSRRRQSSEFAGST